MAYFRCIFRRLSVGWSPASREREAPPDARLVFAHAPWPSSSVALQVTLLRVTSASNRAGHVAEIFVVSCNIDRFGRGTFENSRGDSGVRTFGNWNLWAISPEVLLLKTMPNIIFSLSPALAKMHYMETEY